MSQATVVFQKEKVQPAITSKIEEFHMLGYKEINENELWNYLQQKKWKKLKEEPPLYQIVNDILSVKIMDVMNYVTIESYRSNGLADLNNQEDFSDLFQ
ncbi:post-transcriptional regulator [Metabacillus iocasae]|uniref:Post-transcriptional regulator n=1 Tax=Priestia iocasae TaxID=2291674 RepID=A0ABS2QPL8_9BACI|nr:post-transcriptional regulator [Metabacillus iocasae]MBM7701399.1 hypothetical protein [Metabacillus iocasae]